MPGRRRTRLEAEGRGVCSPPRPRTPNAGCPDELTARRARIEQERRDSRTAPTNHSPKTLGASVPAGGGPEPPPYSRGAAGSRGWVRVEAVVWRRARRSRSLKENQKG